MRTARGWGRWTAVAAVLVCMVGSVAPGAQAETKTVPSSREEITLSFAPVAKRAAPAVVNIYTRKVVERRVSPLFSDPLFRRFFGDAFGLGVEPKRRHIQNSLGSGVIVSADGLIVTNNHVIDDSDEITVVLSDRREFDASIILTDKAADLAVLKVDPGDEDLPYLEFRDSDDLEIGDLVLAIGNPFGVGQTVTSGIISALSRTQKGISDYNFFIQTDAAINPGNSGGALITMDGRLAGINTAIYSRSGGSIGIGFAIPSNMVRVVVAEAAGGKVVHPWLGAKVQTMGSDLAEALGLSAPAGVIVSKLYDQGPAARAGLQVGDVILAIGNHRVDAEQAVRFRLATLQPGRDASLTVWRDKRQVKLSLPVEAPPENPARDERLLDGPHPLSGAKVANLSPALAEELELEDLWDGVIVVGVVRGSAAQRIGLQAGDLIVAVNDTEVDLVSTLEDVLSHRSDHWRLTINRAGRVRTFDIVS
jgi:Do/DeqQ family serine protease